MKNNLTESYLKANKLNWLYIDMNSYFATIEQQVDPSLRNRPIIVVPVLTDATSAVAASYEAKLKGIKTGTKVYEAKKLCPDLICVPAKHDLYVHYHKRIFAEIDKYLHVDHIFSIDEGACRLTGKHCNEEAAIKIAKEIKQAIRKHIGEYISCSIGIAPNRYLAKVATNLKKPDGLIIIKPEDIPSKLYSLKLRDLPGVGSKTHKRLCLRGIDTVEKLYQLDRRSMKLIWGNIWGEKVWYLLRGADLPVEEAKSSAISHSQVLAPELRNKESARNIALSLLMRAASRLRARNLYTSSIALHISTTDKEHFKKAIKIEQTADSSTLAKILLKAWDEIIQSSKIDFIQKININLNNLSTESSQLSFNDFANNNKANQKKQLLFQSIDKLNAKYGKGTISLGQSSKKKETDVAAFGYIPD